jgi:DNA-binding beta-propeller fold protein YncE
MIGSLLVLAGLTAGAGPDPLTLPARLLPLPADPAHLRADGDRLYVSGFHARALVTLTAGRKKSVRELALDAFEDYRTDPDRGEVREVRRAAGGDLAVAAGKVFVGQVFQGSVLVVDRETFTPVKRLPLGGEGCLAAGPDGKAVYFASNAEPEFHVIDTKTYKHRTVPYPPGGRGIGCLAVSPDGTRLYLGIQRGGQRPDGTRLSGANAFLAAYDLEKGAYAGTAFLARERPGGSGDDGIPTSIAFAPDGKRLYVGTFQCEAGVLVVDPRKMEVSDTIYLAPKEQTPAFPWVDPMGVAVFDRWLLVAVRHNREVAAVDLASHRVVARIAQGPAVDYQRVVVAGDRIYLAGASSAVTVVKGKDLSRLLSAVDVTKTGPVRVALNTR